MDYATDQTPLARLGALATAGLSRHRYALVSLALHGAGLALFYYCWNHPVEIAQRAVQLQASAQAATQAHGARRLRDLEKIKALLEKSAAGNGAADAADDIEFALTSPPASPREQLEQARTLAASIDTIARDIKAEELAKLLKIPKEKALKQVPPPPAPPAASPDDPARAAEEIDRLEAQARATLAQRQRELERQEQGVNVGVAGSTGARAATGQAAKPDGAGQGSGDGVAGIGGKSISQQIGAFIHRDLAMPTNPSTPYRLAAGEVAGPGSGQVPALDSAALVTGMGRLFGKEGQFASRVFIDSWYLIGPFDGPRGHDLLHTPHYPPEQAVLLDAAYEGKDGRLLTWKYFKADSYPLVPPDSAEDAVYYGYTELMMDEAADLTMLIGADDDAQVWLNDRLVWQGSGVAKGWFFQAVYHTSNTYRRDFNLNEGSRKVHLRKGRNKVFFKMSNGQARLFFSLVLTR